MKKKMLIISVVQVLAYLTAVEITLANSWGPRNRMLAHWFDWGQIALVLAVYGMVLLIYYILVSRAILQMLSMKANQVLLVFALIALLPFPPFVIMGIVIFIIWNLYKAELPRTTAGDQTK